jgi:FixJ family two-component response regulator
MPMSDDRPTVYVIDDDVSVRDAIKGVLKSVGLRAETFESTQDFLKRNPADGPSCLILDVRLPGLSGLDFQHALGQANINIPIVFVTGYGDIPMTVRAMKAGAIEFLTKPFRDQDLLDAIARALDADRAARRKDAEISELRGRYQTLTARECQVMNLVVAGKLNREIAAELGTSEITVKVQRGHVMRKLQAESVIDLVRTAEKLDLRAPQ